MVARAWKGINTLDNNIVVLPGWITFDSAVHGGDNLGIISAQTYGWSIGNTDDDFPLGRMIDGSGVDSGRLQVLFDESWAWDSIRGITFMQKQPDYDGTAATYNRSYMVQVDGNNVRGSTKQLQLAVQALRDSGVAQASALLDQTIYLTFTMQKQAKNIPFLEDGADG